jgi:hypothetical protein
VSHGAARCTGRAARAFESPEALDRLLGRTDDQVRPEIFLRFDDDRNHAQISRRSKQHLARLPLRLPRSKRAKVDPFTIDEAIAVHRHVNRIRRIALAGLQPLPFAWPGRRLARTA